MMTAAVVIIALRLVAVALFGVLLARSIWVKLRHVAAGAEISRVRVALILLWSSLIAESAYRLWIWGALVARGGIPDAEAAPLTTALLAVAAAVASIWALKPWRDS